MQPLLRHVGLGVFLTAAVALLFVAAIHTVGVKITAPADGDAVAVFALELVAVAPHVTAILDHRKEIELVSAPAVSGVKAGCDSGRGSRRYLVRAIGTVVVTVALPAPSNATAVGAGELALRTLPRH